MTDLFFIYVNKLHEQEGFADILLASAAFKYFIKLLGCAAYEKEVFSAGGGGFKIAAVGSRHRFCIQIAVRQTRRDLLI